MLRFGYNTNGFAHHPLSDTLAVLYTLGYRGVAITLDHYVLNPYEDDLQNQVAEVRDWLQAMEFRSVIETGAQLLLDPMRKHQPTLISPTADQREIRWDFLQKAVDIAAELGSDAVSFWSGTPEDDTAPKAWMDCLAESCRRLSDYAAGKSVRLAFEPEPGMFIDTMTRFAELHERVNHPNFGLTIDIGHLHCQGETPIGDHLRRWKALLWNIHIEDMRRGVHDHLMFGEGEIDFKEVLGVLQEIGYSGGIHVELSRHSYDAVETARRALAFLRAELPSASQSGDRQVEIAP